MKDETFESSWPSKDTSLQMSQLSQVSVSFPNNDEVQESISSIW